MTPGTPTNISFDGSPVSSGWSFIPPTPNFTCPTTGIYSFSYSLLFTAVVSAGLLGSPYLSCFARINNQTTAIAYPGSRASFRIPITALSQSVYQQVNASFIGSITAGDVINLQAWSTVTGLGVGGVATVSVAQQADISNTTISNVVIMRIA
jgi:hypothetical protein